MEFIIRSIFLVAMLFVFIRIIRLIVANMYSAYSLSNSSLSSQKKYRYISFEQNRSKRNKRQTIKQPSVSVIPRRSAMGDGMYNSNYSSYELLKKKYN